MITLKTITQILALVIVFTFSTSFTEAYSLSKGKKTKLYQITKLVDSQIDCPEIARENGIAGTVTDQIQVTESGDINVDEADGHKQLSDYVNSQLTKVKANNIGLIGESINAKIDFRK